MELCTFKEAAKIMESKGEISKVIAMFGNDMSTVGLAKIEFVQKRTGLTASVTLPEHMIPDIIMALAREHSDLERRFKQL